MKFSSEQIQLLSRLNIEPLALHSHFFALDAESISVSDAVYPDLNQSLAQDINFLLQELQVTLSWQLDITASHCRIEGPVLVTPPLQQLQQTSLKKQLWQLLQQVV